MNNWFTILNKGSIYNWATVSFSGKFIRFFLLKKEPKLRLSSHLMWGDVSWQSKIIVVLFCQYRISLKALSVPNTVAYIVPVIRAFIVAMYCTHKESKESVLVLVLRAEHICCPDRCNKTVWISWHWHLFSLNNLRNVIRRSSLLTQSSHDKSFWF